MRTYRAESPVPPGTPLGAGALPLARPLTTGRSPTEEAYAAAYASARSSGPGRGGPVPGGVGAGDTGRSLKPAHRFPAEKGSTGCFGLEARLNPIQEVWRANSSENTALSCVAAFPSF